MPVEKLSFWGYLSLRCIDDQSLDFGVAFARPPVSIALGRDVPFAIAERVVFRVFFGVFFGREDNVYAVLKLAARDDFARGGLVAHLPFVPERSPAVA